MVTIIAQEAALNFSVVHDVELTKPWIGNLSVFDEDKENEADLIQASLMMLQDLSDSEDDE